MSTDMSTTASTASASEGDDPIVGKSIDGCKVIRKIGQGGMGVVYLAEHESLQQPFVLKILNPALTGAEDTVERFFREAQACAQLNHPSIVTIQNVGQEGDYYFIRMEYVEGVTLEDMIKDEGKLNWRKATSMVLETAEALSHAHQKGMIHRDIKPENIMFTTKDEVKVMDFGLAKHVHSATKVSVTGQIVGTPFFMSPEQAGGKPTDARSDIYSLGVTLYYMVTGVKPFNGKNLQEIFLKHFFYAPESPKIYNEALPDSLCAVVKRCLKKKKKERYQSAKALAQDLRGILDDPEAPLGAHGDAPSAATAPDPQAEEGGATVRVQAEEDDGATVQVSGEMGDEQTVQVAGDQEHTVRMESEAPEEKTMVARSEPEERRPRRRASGRNEVTAISFGSQSQSVGSPEDEDEEDPHAGLDLPTSVIQAVQNTGVEEVNANRDPKARRKKLIIAGAIVAIPLLFVMLMYFNAGSNLSDLKLRYEALNQKGSSPEVLQELNALAQDYGQFIEDNSLFQGKVSDAQKIKALLEEKAKSIKAEIDRGIERERELAEIERKRKERLAQFNDLEARVSGLLGRLEELKQAALAAIAETGNAGDLWKQYMELAEEFLRGEDAQAIRDEFSELLPRLEEVRFPVLVTSSPAGVEVTLNQNDRPEPSLGKVTVVWVKPYEDFTLRVGRSGFLDQRWTAHAELPNDGFTTVLSKFFELERRQLRDAFGLGTHRVTMGANKEEKAIVPAHDVRVVGSQRSTAYFVGLGGVLRAVGLKGGRPRWFEPENPHEHDVGLYGDPTPTLEVVEGRVILASSLLGTVSAHDPSQGTRIWSRSLDSPVTSSPRYYQVEGIIAVGTADGRVVFLEDQAGRERGSFPTENAVQATPYFVGERICVAGSTDNRLYALDWRKVELLSYVDLGADVVLGPIPIMGRRLLVGTADGKLHIVDIKIGTGSLNAQLTLEELAGAGLAAPVTGIAVEGTQFVYTVGNRMGAYAADGSSLWEKPFKVLKGSLTAPVVQPDGDLIYVGSSGGTLYAVDRATGSTRWTFIVPAKEIRVAPFVVEKELFVIGGDTVHVLAAD